MIICTVILGLPGKQKGKNYWRKKKLKILSPNGTLKVAKEDFVGEYLGQTATKTKTIEFMFRRCITCRWSICIRSWQKDRDSFSKEAIDIKCIFIRE